VARAQVYTPAPPWFNPREHAGPGGVPERPASCKEGGKQTSQEPEPSWYPMLMWLLFFFVAFGAKAILAVAMIYLMLESERDCANCACETIPIRMGGGGRALQALSMGYVQRRWCPRCGWEGLTRSGRMGHAGAPSSSGAPSLR